MLFFAAAMHTINSYRQPQYHAGSPKDRSVRFLTSLAGASTSRVLNLHEIAHRNKQDAGHARRPLFLSPVINNAFVLKQPLRADESYRLDFPISMVTKVIVPFDLNDLGAGGRSIVVEERGFADAIKSLGHYNNQTLERDLVVLRLLNAIPTFDPFLLRQHLENNKIDVASCYFPVSQSDQDGMHAFVTKELCRLTNLVGKDVSITSTDKMVKAMLSSDVAEELAPLRDTLNLTGKDFCHGVFSWRGFLYYKWSLDRCWPNVMGVLREISKISPSGVVKPGLHAFLTQSRRSVIELVRDNAADVARGLAVYDASFADLVANQAPKAFRDFLLNAPHMFFEIGEKMGALTHIADCWRHRFPAAQAKSVDAEELSSILHDYQRSFRERLQPVTSPIARPAVIDRTGGTRPPG